MSTVLELVEQSKQKNEGKEKVRKTKNADEYLQMLVAVLSDDSYIAKDLKEIKDGEVIIEDKKIAPGFRKLIVAIFKSRGMSEEEATEAAKSFKIKKEFAKAIMEAVRECDYLVTKECGKKIQLFKKPGFEIAMTVEEAKESIRPNPQDDSKRVRIKKRDRVKIFTTLHAFQKEIIKA